MNTSAHVKAVQVPPFGNVPKHIIEYCHNKWGLSDMDLIRGRVRYSTTKEALVFPIITVHGREIGFNLRSVTDKGPKSRIVITDADYPLMSCYVNSSKENVVIIVEDQISAIKASRYVTAVALLGVNFDVVKAQAIKYKYAPKTEIFALDKDAIPTAMKYVSEFRDFITGMKVLPLQKDLKDCTYEEIDAQIKKVTRGI